MQKPRFSVVFIDFYRSEGHPGLQVGHLGPSWGTLGLNLEALGGQGRHMGGTWEAYERLMGGIGRQRGAK